MTEKIHPIHLFFLVYMTQVGVILFTLPRIIALNFGTNGWILISLISLFVLGLIVLMDFIYRWQDGKSIYEVLEGIFPGIIHKLLYLFLSIFWAISAFTIAKKYVSIVKMIFYPSTNVNLLLVVFVVLLYFFVTSSIQAIVRSIVFLFFLTVWLDLLVLYFIPDFEWVHLTPYFFEYRGDLFGGSIETFSAFLGFELVLFLFHFIEQTPKAMRYVYFAHVLTTMVYLVVTFIAYGFTSFHHLTTQVYPIISMLRYFQLPFIERIDGLIFILFMMKVLVTSGMYMWVAVQMLLRIRPVSHPPLAAFFLFAISFIVTYSWNTRYELDLWIQNMIVVQSIITLTLIALLFFYLLLKRRRAHNEA
ncbi:GerAB/ArcD/ProY family transporter [Halalkalibacter oceani]|uniref:GerAB/ArcD/ProY family transporter n=1 Tax=Halalkalibacter oceani TaxID=1653776 RepID=UPI0033927BC0